LPYNILNQNKSQNYIKILLYKNPRRKICLIYYKTYLNKNVKKQFFSGEFQPVVIFVSFTVVVTQPT
jgi:hypothetical protein